jgi:predicted dehydrogenase
LTIENGKLKIMRAVSVLISAIGGYGHYYLKTLFEEIPEDKAFLAGVIDPQASGSEYYEKILSQNIPVYSNIEKFYEDGHNADLAVISSPIHYHVPQSVSALINGSYVLCDKPAGATVQEVAKLIDIKNGCNKWVKIGYQWSFSESIQSLKYDILNGIFGKAIRLKSICLWPRTYNYYSRNYWAGRIKDKEGRWIIDHPANNAFAHFIHNMLFVLGKDISSSTKPKYLTGELYKAFDIENGDTIVCKVFTDDGVEILFYGSHSTKDVLNPLFEFEFENAKILLDEKTRDIIAIFNDGNIKNYGSPDNDHQFRKLFNAIENVNKTTNVICGPEAAIAQTMCANAIQESSLVNIFPDNLIVNEQNRPWVKGLQEMLISCYKKNILPGEAGYVWARSGNIINLENYNNFPMANGQWRIVNGEE